MMSLNEAMGELVKKINTQIDEVFYTDHTTGIDHPLERVEYAGRANIACYVADQEVPVGYIDVEELAEEMRNESLN